MKKTQFIRAFVILLLVFSSLNSSAQRRTAVRTTASKDVQIERQVNALLAKMTLAEKLGQLQQLDGEANGKYRPEHLELARKGLLGSTSMCAARK